MGLIRSSYRTPTTPARPALTKPVSPIRNRSQYNDGLVQRGSLTLWVEQAALQAWRYQGPAQRGARFPYSDTAIECLLTLPAVYHLPLRAAEGSSRSLFGLMGLDLPVPDSSTLGRRARAVRITLPERAEGPLHLILDGPGLEVYGEGDGRSASTGIPGAAPG